MSSEKPKTQREKFEEACREFEADMTAEELAAVIRKIAPKRKPKET